MKQRYGVGRKEKNQEIETLRERIVRWTLGVDRSTPGYAVRYETGRQKIATEEANRAMKYQEKLWKAKEGLLRKE